MDEYSSSRARGEVLSAPRVTKFEIPWDSTEETGHGIFSSQSNSDS